MSYSGLQFIYYQILTDKRCSENSQSLDEMGIDGMLELYEMLCALSELQSAAQDDAEKEAKSNKPR